MVAHLSDAIEIYKCSLTLQDLSKILLAYPKISRSCLQDVSLGRAFDNRVSIKHPSITRLAKCILREQARFEIDIERLRTGEQPKKKKKIYENLDARIEKNRVVL